MQRVLALVFLSVLGLSPTTASAHVAVPRTLTQSMHALEDARHASDQLNLAPATGKPIQRIVPTTTPPLRREIFGFAPYWNLNKYREWNFSLLSTVAYFGLDVNPDGTFATQGPGWDGWNSADLTAIINTAHAAGDKVVLVIKNFRDDSLNTVLTNSRPNLISQTIAAIASKNLDGVNVDFEGSGSPLFPDIPLGITTFMTELAPAVHARWPQAEVSIDTYAGAASWDGGIFRITDLAKVVDAMFVMAYDSVFENMPGQAGPQSPMNGWTFNDTVDVSQYLTKAPASKIILGVPYYGYKWSTVNGNPYSTVTSGGTAEAYTDVVGELTCGHIAMNNGWDATAQSPWAAWWSPQSGDPCGGNLNAPRELYYDNAASLGIKYDLVNANNLRGAGMWTLGYDSGYSDLWNELSAKFTATTSWTSLGGGFISSPASSVMSGRVDVFAVGGDRALYQKSWNGTQWSGWASLGGVITADPAAVSWGPNRVDVFARGTDNALWHRWWDTGGWHEWESLGGVLLSGPDVASWGPGRLDVFVVGTDSGLWHKAFGVGGWSNWESLGGRLTADPAAVSWGPNRVDVFGRGTNYSLFHKWWDASGWHDWEGLGGYWISEPTAASCAAGHMDVFTVGLNSGLYRLGFTGTAWGLWQGLGGQWTSGGASACPSASTLNVFERGPDLALWQTSLSPS